MFYSHTFLARKGPLGTVWCAAHLQHKLKKSHYASTDIPSTVDRIIFPEVPMALRMSGHLLLGVVRIYSKKVEYLKKDCDVLWISLRNAFCTTDVNLPEDKNQAQFNAVTYPETYALDAIDMEDDLSLVDGSQDNHLRNIEDITLQDQYPVQTELYVRITFDDDIIPDSLHSEQRESDSMQIDNPPEVSIPLSPDIQNTGNNQNEETLGPEGESLPPHEIMRDYQGNDVHLPSPILRPHQENVDPKLTGEISPLEDMPEMEIDTPLSIHASAGVHSEQPLLHEGPSSPTSEARVVSDSLVNVSPTELLLRPSPSPSPSPSPENPMPQPKPQPKLQPKPQTRKRKRKLCFDESLVLTNELLKKSLNDCSDLVKKRRKLPSSALELWRFREKKKNEEVFSKPLISGMCENLQNLLSKDFIVSNPKLVVTEEAQLESRTAESPAHVPNVGEETERVQSPDRDPAQVPNVYEETECLRSPDRDLGPTIVQPFPSSPLFSPRTLGNTEPYSSPRIPSSVSEPRFEATDPQSDFSMFTNSTVFEMETPIINSEERNDDIGTALSDIPEVTNSLGSDALLFLEQDNDSPTDSEGARTKDTMSARTRAVARYLENHSPSKFPDGPSDELSLNSILEGRRRKLCARMFYETLVLKSEGLIEVKQDEPYGDIMLKLNAKSLYTQS